MSHTPEETMNCQRECLLRLLVPDPRKSEQPDGGAVRQLTRDQRRALRDPEVRKNVEIIVAHLADAVELQRRRPFADKVAERLAELSVEANRSLHLGPLLEARRCIEQLLLECADLTLLQQWAAAEYAEEEATLPTWRRLYGPELPALLQHRDGAIPDHVIESTRARLQRLVAARFWLYRPVRARRSLRTRYVRWVGLVLFVTSLLFAAVAAVQIEPGVVGLAAAGGSVGASLSGLLQFRDEVRLGSQVREFLPFYLAQVIVGAVFGLVVVLVIEAHWLNVDVTSAALGAIAFAAGFSEPFAVGVVTAMTERVQQSPAAGR